MISSPYNSQNSDALEAYVRQYGVLPIVLQNASYKMTPELLQAMVPEIDPTAWETWNTLSPAKQQDVLNRYITTHEPTGLFKSLKDNTYTNDLASFLTDLNDLPALLEMYNNISEYPDLSTIYQNALSQIESENEAMYSDLDSLLAEYTDSYNTQIQNSRNNYDMLRRNIVEQQYAQNAQLMDTFNANLDRSRRNAIEAGASAGIRIADNVNQLLSVQNKQSATAMDTANQLTQLMINQRNAEASANSDYLAYKAQDVANRHAISNSTRSRATSLRDIEYDNALARYDKDFADFTNTYGDSGFYDLSPKFQKSTESSYDSAGNLVNKPRYSWK